MESTAMTRPLLSPREVDVLETLVEVGSDKAIARKLGVSRSTVNEHLDSIFRKLGVRSRTQAVVQAAKLGIIRL